jgi:hypothetical protein
MELMWFVSSYASLARGPKNVTPFTAATRPGEFNGCGFFLFVSPILLAFVCHKLTLSLVPFFDGLFVLDKTPRSW